MVSLLNLSLDDLSQADVLAFVGRIDPILDALYPGKSSVVVQKFLGEVENYIAVQQSQTVKISGKEIEDCDHLADDEWRALDCQIKAGIYQHFNAEQREAAIGVHKIFSKYKDPTDMRYVKEYDILDKLLAELEKLPVEILRQAKVDENVMALRKRVDDFRTLYTNKIKPEAEEEIGLARDVRVRLNKWWGAVHAQIYADMFEKTDDHAFNEAVDTLNAAIRSVTPEF